MIYICNIYTIYTYVDIGIPCTYVRQKISKKIIMIPDVLYKIMI